MFFLRFLKKKFSSALFFLICSAVFAAAFLLFHINIRAVIYPFCVCAFFGIIFLVTEYLSASKNHQKLLRLKNMSANIISSLNLEEEIEDEDYRKIISSLLSQQQLLNEEMTGRYFNTVDYYTVWAHQIKTPIASMKLSLQNEDSLLSRKLSSDLFRIEQYVEMVMMFLRLDSETTDYVFREYNLDDIIKSSVRKFSGDFILKKLSLNYEETNVKIVTDEKWLGFVIEQILSNSLKYTSSGGITIKADGENLIISDTGIGIDPADLPRIFEKGYTGLGGRTSSHSSGIGLYLCKRICSSLGIKISAESEIGKGTAIKLGLSQKKYSGE